MSLYYIDYSWVMIFNNMEGGCQQKVLCSTYWANHLSVPDYKCHYLIYIIGFIICQLSVY